MRFLISKTHDQIRRLIVYRQANILLRGVCRTVGMGMTDTEHAESGLPHRPHNMKLFFRIHEKMCRRTIDITDRIENCSPSVPAGQNAAAFMGQAGTTMTDYLPANGFGDLKRHQYRCRPDRPGSGES